ncbi:MAG TPA: 16S rRNA (uracil(1498)-N(3))-methyltransferase [Nitrospirales bacterium]|jgi:16S rRNA (uracil1498-N3)-methyltransferase
MPVFFVEPGAIQDDCVTITGPLAHHLTDSLRVKPNEEIWLARSGGPRYRARVLCADAGLLTATILSRSELPPASTPRITLGLALVKKEHMDWAIQKATELGVARLVPLITSRTMVRVRAERIPNRVVRWGAIAREAAQQSMRWEIPEVTEPESFEIWCEKEQQATCRLLLWENPQGRLLRESLRGTPRPSTLAVAIGPEGGFDAEEVTKAQQSGFETVSLGTRILRTESAVLATLAIIQYEWGGLG